MLCSYLMLKASFFHLGLSPHRSLTRQEVMAALTFEAADALDAPGPIFADPQLDEPILQTIQYFFYKLQECDSQLSAALSPTHESGLMNAIGRRLNCMNSKGSYYSGGKGSDAEFFQRMLEIYCNHRLDEWSDFERQYNGLFGMIVHESNGLNWSIRKFMDFVSKPTSDSGLHLVRILEQFHLLGQDIVWGLIHIYNLIELTYLSGQWQNNAPLGTVVSDLLEYIYECRFSLFAKEYQIRCIITDSDNMHMAFLRSRANLEQRIKEIETNTDWGGTAKHFAKHFDRNEDTMRHHMRAAHKEGILRCAVEVGNDEVEEFLQFMSRPGKLRKQKKS